ncbi:DUF262 domain-containing protein [Flavobacterium sp. 7A]|uniref:DUF262 domain-containing protein n=1 Tax=Flavobacterium sp. 7A TaxID=2940571 RepID=UPI002227F090|nr:DUF262 domain-containing HNH endonuclease family protein [Flavobacterium sp. 7A]MCW2119788.1 uncharacterized protein with ParB-like and HNH nuclease domain [Flavobacterium sp. 7A]
MEDKLRIRPLSELIGYHFFIPRYQRGYRWGKQEITDLLNDILQYHNRVSSINKDNKVSKFYCLQPIVVKSKEWESIDNGVVKRKTGWELIDGQQRLTTLFIILSYLEDIRQFYDGNKEIYSIDFETREDCIDFFNNRKFVDNIDESNVDFYHISKAYSYVAEWFKDKPTIRLDFLKRILDKEYNVSIIWYEAEDNSIDDNNDSSIDLFTRLNDGKIPLTDAELIKALLLQNDCYPDDENRYTTQRLFEIASEWDAIEANLQDDKFWYFLNETSYSPSSKIEFIFKILADEWNVDMSLISYDEIDGKPKNYEYLVFDRYLNKKRDEYDKIIDSNEEIIKPINDIWKEVKEKYNIVFEWYNNHAQYHYIGYLLAMSSGNNESIIKKLISRKLSKTAFIHSVKKDIGELIEIKKKKKNSIEIKSLSELTYGKDNKELIRILLLLNIDVLVKQNKENSRFPFHLFKIDKITSLEHIHPQNPESIDTEESRCITWLKSHTVSLRHLTSNNPDQKIKIENLIFTIDELIKHFDPKTFKIVYSDVIELYSEISDIKDSEVDTLYNLALVDKDTNSSLNNSFFDIKREILKQNKFGRYIPIFTQRVFSKYYSQSPNEMIFWSNEDRKSYFTKIENVYKQFIELK